MSGRDRILDAFEEAVVRHGGSASFGQTAAIGGFHRSLVQHHFGTRQQLLIATADRIVDMYRVRLEELCAEPEPVDALVYYLTMPFGEGGPSRPSKVVDALVAMAHTNEPVRDRIAVLYELFIEAVAGGLAQRYPHAPPERREHVAYSVVAMSFGRGGLEVLGFGRGRPAWTACHRLIDDLSREAAILPA